MKITTHAENISVLYEDNHLIAISKRVGDIVQGDKTGDTPLSDILKAYLKDKYNKPNEAFLGVVHRLDRPTTGIVLFAKTSKALARLNAMFANKEEVQKTYWALVDAPPPQAEGTLKTLQHYYLLEIKLITGRHHQIRAQFAAVGCHIKGDLKYGAKRSNPDGGISLHAYQLAFVHPVKKELITLTNPPHWKELT